MDRRHIVLAVALAASVATKRVAPPPLYYGHEELYAGSFVLDAKHPTRNWIIVTEAVLPKEAADYDPNSITVVQAELPEGALAYPVALSLSQCADAGETDVLETQPSGIPAALLWIGDAFADCVPLEPCVRTFCVELSNGDDEIAAEVAWATSTGIESEDTGVNEDDASIPVSIEITIEEVSAVIDRRPGGALLHPVAIASIAILILNDHLLKPTYSNWITGKLSDFAGLVFFPLLLVSAWELARRRAPARTALNVACVATAIVFTLAKTTAVGSLAFQWGLGLAQWPFRVLAGHSLAPVAHVMDATDLIALPSIALAWWIGAARTRAPRAASTV